MSTKEEDDIDKRKETEKGRANQERWTTEQRQNLSGQMGKFSVQSIF